MNVNVLWLVVLGLAVSMGAAHANGEAAALPTLAEIRAQQIDLQADVQKGSGRFKDMKPSDRTELARRQAELLKLIDGKASVDELNEKNKTLVFNELEWIKAKITGAEDDRMVCERHRPAGSNRVERTCLTVAERRRMREGAVKDLMGRNNCMDPAGCRAN